MTRGFVGCMSGGIKLVFGCVPFLKTIDLQGEAFGSVDVGAWVADEPIQKSTAFIMIEILQGEGTVLRNGVDFEVKAPCYWVSVPSEAVSLVGSEHWQLRVLMLDGRLLESVSPNAPSARALETWRRAAANNAIWQMTFGVHTEIHRLWNEMEALHDSEDNAFSAIALIWQITAQLRRLSVEELPQRAPTPSRRMIVTVQYMQENFGSKILLADLARLANMSVSNFSAVFRRTYGIPPMEYLLRMRIRHAAYLLQHTDDKVIMIAEECGFFSNSNFIKAFTHTMGKTPSEYRKHYHSKGD